MSELRPPPEADETQRRAAAAFAAVENRMQLASLLWKALGERAYQWAVLFLVAGAWGYVLVSYAPFWPTVLRIVAAALFTAFVSVPLWRRPALKKE